MTDRPAVIIHDFTERLEFSQHMGDEPTWIAYYQKVWPLMLCAVRIDANSTFQERGIDRMIHLPNGKVISIDEKVRDPVKAKDSDGDPYDDILIEEFSVFLGLNHPGNKVGWTLDPKKQCDYVAYALPLLQKCFLLPFELLRIAARRNLPEWKTLKDRKGRKCYPLDAPNRGYQTRNCAVSWPHLSSALNREMERERRDSELLLPVPELHYRQAVFDWTSE